MFPGNKDHLMVQLLYLPHAFLCPRVSMVLTTWSSSVLMRWTRHSWMTTRRLPSSQVWSTIFSSGSWLKAGITLGRNKCHIFAKTFHFKSSCHNSLTERWWNHQINSNQSSNTDKYSKQCASQLNPLGWCKHQSFSQILSVLNPASLLYCSSHRKETSFLAFRICSSRRMLGPEAETCRLQWSQPKKYWRAQARFRSFKGGRYIHRHIVAVGWHPMMYCTCAHWNKPWPHLEVLRLRREAHTINVRRQLALAQDLLPLLANANMPLWLQTEWVLLTIPLAIVQILFVTESLAACRKQPMFRYI